MESFLMKALQLVVALAFLVIIHEFGHYIIARMFGIKVEKFYLFFNPWFSLAKWKPKKGEPKHDKNGNERATWRDTEYGIGWLPLGGYVKIAGMIDESMDKEQLKKPAQPWEFRSKPAYQRLLVMIGGVMFNFILAILIYAGIAFWWGNKYIPLDKATEGMDFSPVAIEAGFRNGDIPLLADGKPIDASQEDFLYTTASASTVTVLRDGKDTVNISLPSDFIVKLGKNGFMMYRQPVVVDKVQGLSAAQEAGIKEGDRILAIDTISTRAYSELTPALLKYAGKKTTVTVERDGKLLKLPVTPSESGKLGFQLKHITDVYPTVTVSYGFFQSFPKGWENGTNMLSNYVGSMKHIFSKEGAQSIGGFGAIGDMFPDKWNWLSFWEITAFLSVALAFMNILPIPALDGGHVLFLLYEMIFRRQAPEKVLEYAQMAGMCFLLALLLYANGADLVRAVLN
ncbi:MAG: RIP metalloprotease RseP [Firmicutes bacterium]|nr:RIP metalloprotease RseP [Bacillota bacterium]MCM1401264.1 RIP metalloprotease RseP [Bacteroides sp.]MCM1477187.1 RIP metalloprotease RseP [Bacteroides sp.]